MHVYISGHCQFIPILLNFTFDISKRKRVLQIQDRIQQGGYSPAPCTSYLNKPSKTWTQISDIKLLSHIIVIWEQKSL